MTSQSIVEQKFTWKILISKLKQENNNRLYPANYHFRKLTSAIVGMR